MPASGIPSIVQQRLILVAFLAVIGALVWSQYAPRDVDHRVQKFSISPLPNNVEQLNFEDAEAGWSALQLDARGQLEINALTDTALADAMALMKDEPSEALMKRMAFLLEKQFGATASEQIIQLLPVLQRYKEAEQRWLAENGTRNPTPYAELFQLQDEMLGKALADRLFAKQRRLTDMMLASQRIQSDATLSPAEKDQALSDLQKALHDESAVVE